MDVTERNDVDAAIAPIAARQLGLFTRQQAAEVGWSRHQLDRRVRAARVRRMFTGVFADNSAPRTWEQAVLGAVFAAGRDAVASHLTAAALHGFPDTSRDTVMVSVPAARSPRTRGYTVHRVQLEPVDVTVSGPIPVTTIARTLVDCSGLLSLGQIARALDDALVRRRTTLWAVEQCHERLGNARLRRPSMLRTLLAERDPAVERMESRPEMRVFRTITAAGLRAPTPQHEVVVAGNRFRLDFAYPDVKLGLEYMGFDPHRSRTAQDRDFRRHRLLQGAGWKIVFITSATSDDEIVASVAAFVA